MAKLLRDNAADARVADDVAALAAAYNDSAVEATVAAIRQAQADDYALLAEAFAEPSTGQPWWKATAAQILRYRGYSVAAVVILAVVVFMHPAPRPVGDDDSGNTALIPTADARHAGSATAAAEVPAVTDPFDFGFAVPSSEADDALAPASSFDTTPVTYAPAPSVLQISQSGYASRFAPTPAEQEPPDGGLPAQSVAGQVVRYSYMRLTGSGTVLRLQATEVSNADTARVQLCHVTTAGWKPARATPMSEAPQYNAECVEGRADKKVWTFEFAVFNAVDPNGWAIVPITAGNATFQVTFAPTAA